MARSFRSFTLALAATTVWLGGTALWAQSAPSESPQQKDLQEALNLLQQNRYPEAIKKLEAAKRKYPELSSPHVMMYNWAKQLNQANNARRELELAVRDRPNDPETFLILGDIALNEGRIAEAALDLDKAKQLVEKYSTNTDRKKVLQQFTTSSIAQLAEIRQDWKTAETLLRDFLQSDPKNLIALQRLARAQFQQGQAADAYATLKKSKDIDRENATKNKTREAVLTPEAIMAKFYFEFEGPQSETPEKWYRSALRKAPDDLPTRREVCIWALGRGMLPFAKEQAEAALRIEQADPALKGSNVGRMLRGVVALWQKDWPEAEKNFQLVILENPSDMVAKNNMALALVEQDDPAKKQKALAYAEGNYRINNNNPDILSTLGWVHFRRGEFDTAAIALDGAIKASNGQVNNADTLTYLAHILHHLGQSWKAKDILEPILKNNAPFSMRPEAKELAEKVKDAKRPADATPTAVPSGR